MTFCPHCGKENPEDATQCQHCEEPLETAGPPPRLLSQIQGLLLPEPVITTGRLQDPSHALPLETLPPALGQAEPEPEPEPVPEPPPPQPSPPQPKTAPQAFPPFSLWTVAALFFLLALGGSLWPKFYAQPAAVFPSVKNAYAFIEVLPRDARVLVAWDYDPATQGELRLLAHPILYHLQRRNIATSFVSLTPFGPNMAADALAYNIIHEPAIASRAPLPVQLGYLPGEEVALRSLVHSPIRTSNRPAYTAQAWQKDPAADLDQTVDLIIEFSSDFGRTQAWVEQVAARSQVPLVVAASAAVAPMLRPYEQTGQIRALLSGYPDALAYEHMLGIQRGPAARQALSQSLLHAALIGVVLVAGARSLWRRRS